MSSCLHFIQNLICDSFNKELYVNKYLHNCKLILPKTINIVYNNMYNINY